MFLKERASGQLVEVIQLDELFNPKQSTLEGCYQIGETDQDRQGFTKSDLIFMSGEELPGCWVEAENQR